jgi:hypothetical protein
MKTLSLADGLKIQRTHLDEWAMLLKPEVQAIVEAEATRQNLSLETDNQFHDGYDVWRGTSIDSFVANLPNTMRANH